MDKEQAIDIISNLDELNVQLTRIAESLDYIAGQKYERKLKEVE